MAETGIKVLAVQAGGTLRRIETTTATTNTNTNTTGSFDQAELLRDVNHLGTLRTVSLLFGS